MSALHVTTDMYVRMPQLRVRGASCYIVSISPPTPTLLLSFSTYFLICLPLDSLHPGPHLRQTLLFPLLFIAFTLPPIRCYPHSFIWYSCSPPPIIPSVSVILLSAIWREHHIGAGGGGMGGPLLPADFNEFLWGSDQKRQKWRSALQPAGFNASLLTTLSSLHVSKT